MNRNGGPEAPHPNGTTPIDAAERGIEMGRDEARTIVYGMSYPEFKARHQAEATPEQLAAFDASRRSP